MYRSLQSLFQPTVTSHIWLHCLQPHLASLCVKQFLVSMFVAKFGFSIYIYITIVTFGCIFQASLISKVQETTEMASSSDSVFKSPRPPAKRKTWVATWSCEIDCRFKSRKALLNCNLEIGYHLLKSICIDMYQWISFRAADSMWH